ncbi:uncharacterized protein MYCFIDRAFT_81375 [Pseudocercospora fijiensis CIRAD86]|uniref:Uncharacterized protein n=1 Tax=Pseudocercospora fijiensis (strain CIRAD86) TaxID=383855 RepID=M3AW11_PSEFD|nr:uncharacterized protein MYCFIDRAFT_81375 [Pseudocercospora fijiensis CIRAD86]EME81303.1 hypothetical protein MYCFIDRAFT_81375 [Pseudocercospora fijiensis CIRAD86]
MASTDQVQDLRRRLKTKQYDPDDCIAAIKGQRIPSALGLPLLRLCTIRGIRFNDGFAKDLRGILPSFTRALNARDIMSNRVPVIASDEETPYCIWHPEVASESTYRQLVTAYPQMSYQVGRACAVAGYSDLYKELDIVPEVHIAEEARECGNLAIFDRIMAQPTRYEVMNDYTRTINASSANLPVAHLNGDTAVESSLNVRQEFSSADVPEIIDGVECITSLDGPGYRENIFDITEDMNIDIVNRYPLAEAEGHDVRHGELLVRLLTEPLPTELPTVDKDLLLLMAAYYGDIDRYARLRRPSMITGEYECCVRGVYHNTMFAVWWSKQARPKGRAGWKLSQAICARFIMNNVLSKVTDEAFDMPYLIWYPAIASESTYRKLAEMSPGMLPQILRACIVANYAELFDSLAATTVPDEAVVKEAEKSTNPHFHSVLANRVEEVGQTELGPFERWKLETSDRLFEWSSKWIWKTMAKANPQTYGDELQYNGTVCAAGDVELMACLPDEWRISEGGETGPEPLDYVNWPPEGKRP